VLVLQFVLFIRILNILVIQDFKISPNIGTIQVSGLNMKITFVIILF